MLEKWQKVYDSKLITFEQFPDLLQDGDVWENALGTCAVSAQMQAEVAKRYKEFKNVVYADTVQVKPHAFFDTNLLREMHGHVDYLGWYWLPAIGKFTKQNVADFSTIMTEDCTQAISRVTNVFTFMCTPPNEQGFVNLGLCNFFHKELIRRGRETGALRTVVAEINDQMPTVFGDNWVHINDIDYFIENSSPVPAFGHPIPDEIDSMIGDNCLELVRDGDCVQMGLGGLTEPVIEKLDTFHDLGTNSEMIIMGLPHLAEAGAITNLNRVTHPGVSTATLIMGDQRLYDFCTENPAVNIFCCDYINHPKLVSRDPQVLAINMALNVDFGGQISAESEGYRQISGPGGQLDFAIGAHWSEGGRSVVLMRAAHTDKNGNLVSNIQPSFTPGTTVTVPRAYADFIITEYGIASLRGKSRRARAKELIAIAHPDLRADLKKAALDAYWAEDMRTDEMYDWNWDLKQHGYPAEFWLR